MALGLGVELIRKEGKIKGNRGSLRTSQEQDIFLCHIIVLGISWHANIRHLESLTDWVPTEVGIV